MAWAKRHQLVTPARLDLSTSAVSSPAIEDLGGIPRELPLTGNNAYGHPDLVRRIAGRYGIGDDRVLPLTGASFGNFLVAAAVVQPGDRVAVEQPAYEPLLRVVEAAGGEIVRAPRRSMESGWAVDPREIRKASLVILTNLHNPSGAAMDAATVKACAEKGATLLVDEVYLDSAFRAKVEPAVTLAPNAVSTSSFTKSYGLGGLRAGWAAGPARLIQRMKEIRDSIDVLNSYPNDILSIQAWEKRDALLARARRRFEENWPVVEAWLKARPDWRCTPPAGGFVCFPRVPDGIDVPRLLERLDKEYGCAVTPGEFFGEPRHVRIGFGGDRKVLEEGLAAIAEASNR